jgi:hypothetical protein
MILAELITISTLVWIAIPVGLFILASIVIKLLDIFAEPRQRRKAYEFWIREQQGAFDGKLIRFPKNYHKFVGEFEAGRFPM